ANRASERLLKFGVLEAGDKYHFEIAVDGEPRRSSLPEAVLGSSKVTVKTPPLQFLSVSLRAVLKQGRAVDEQDEEAFHVFFTEAAFAASEKFSRQGASESKPIETGAALGGFLCLASDGGDGGDFFSVVTDVFEAVNSAG